MTERAIAVLVPASRTDPPPPEALPFGRAALRLEAEGIPVVVGCEAREGRLRGFRARPGRWEPADLPVAAALDRFPQWLRRDEHRALLAGLAGTPVANPPIIDELCRDKVVCQQALCGLRWPEVEADPRRFADAVDRWGVAFHKPRYGALGHGVRRVVPGDELPALAEGAPGRLDPAFVQRGVPPPAGWAGIAVRALVQREGEGFVLEHPVARRSRMDAVVNAARGAEVEALHDALPGAVDEVTRLAVGVADALARAPGGELLVELGVDLVVDRDGLPWLVEVNGKPRGRLEVLAGRDPSWQAAHVRVSARPLRWLAEHYLSGRP